MLNLELDGGYSVDYYASANLWQLQKQLKNKTDANGNASSAGKFSEFCNIRNMRISQKSIYIFSEAINGP